MVAIANGPRFAARQGRGNPWALSALEAAKQVPLELLRRHARAIGARCAEDAQENNLSVDRGFRILSATRCPPGSRSG